MATATQQQKQTTTIEQPAQQTPLLDKAIEATAKKIDDVAGKYAKALEDPALQAFQRTLLTAQGIESLESILDDKVMARLMRLMNTPLGFLTDKPTKTDPGLYDVATVRRCIVAALLQGFFPVGNEMNIIAGKFYGAKAGYKRKCEELPGISDLEVIPGVPKLIEGRTVVRVRATWKMDGPDGKRIDKELTGADGQPGRVFAVRVNQGSTDDATIGKAERKAYKAIYELMTGTKITEGDDVETDKTAAVGDPPAGRMPMKTQTNGAAVVAETPKEPEREPGVEPEETPPAPQEPDPRDTLGNQLKNDLDDATTPEEVEDILKHIGDKKKELGASRHSKLTHYAGERMKAVEAAVLAGAKKDEDFWKS